jgi:hypothetical protein
MLFLDGKRQEGIFFFFSPDQFGPNSSEFPILALRREPGDGIFVIRGH